MIIPTIIEKTKNGERVYDIYSKLLQDRIIFIGGEITDDVANVVVGELLYLNSISKDDISIYINSPGGSVTAGFAIYDTMNFIECDVNTICIGMCASMAAFILSSGTKGKRYALKNSEIMIHQPLGGVNGQATEIAIVCGEILKVKKKINQILSNNTGRSIKQIENDTERDYYMNSSDAIKYGIIDKML